jgi:hypothetical protein
VPVSADPERRGRRSAGVVLRRMIVAGLYDFESLKGVVEDSRAAPLPDVAAASSLIESKAAAVGDAGLRTHVRGDAGRIVFLTGVATVRRLAQAC